MYSDIIYANKYKKYKLKYLKLLKQLKGGEFQNENENIHCNETIKIDLNKCLTFGFHNYLGTCWYESLITLLLQSDSTRHEIINFFLNYYGCKYKYDEYFDKFLHFDNVHILPVYVYIEYLKYLNHKNLEGFYKNLKLFFWDQIGRFIRKFIENEEMTYDSYILQHINDEIRAITDEKKIAELENEKQFLLNNGFKEPSQQYTLPTNISNRFNTIRGQRRLKQGFFNGITNTPPEPETQSEKCYFFLNPLKYDQSLLICELFNLFVLRGPNMYKLGFTIINVPYLMGDHKLSSLYEEKFFKFLKNLNLVGIQISLFIPNKTIGHAITLYKCLGIELLYDDNLEKPYKYNWTQYLLANFKQKIYYSKDNIGNFFTIVANDTTYVIRSYKFIYKYIPTQNKEIPKLESLLFDYDFCSHVFQNNKDSYTLLMNRYFKLLKINNISDKISYIKKKIIDHINAHGYFDFRLLKYLLSTLENNLLLFILLKLDLKEPSWSTLFEYIIIITVNLDLILSLFLIANHQAWSHNRNHIYTIIEKIYSAHKSFFDNYLSDNTYYSINIFIPEKEIIENIFFLDGKNGSELLKKIYDLIKIEHDVNNFIKKFIEKYYIRIDAMEKIYYARNIKNVIYETLKSRKLDVGIHKEAVFIYDEIIRICNQLLEMYNNKISNDNKKLLPEFLAAYNSFLVKKTEYEKLTTLKI